MNPSLPGGSSLSGIRDLHLAPSSRTNDSLFVPLLQEATTWEGTLRLHLQSHPIPWTFALPPRRQQRQDHENGEGTAVFPTSLNLSDAVLEELLQLLRELPHQGRSLILLLEQTFILEASQLHRILQAAAPSLIRVETNHPRILKWLSSSSSDGSAAHLLEALVMEISNDADLQMQQIHGLITLLQDSSFLYLHGLHLHLPSGGGNQGTSKTTLSTTENEMLALFCLAMRRRKSLRALKLSGDLERISHLLLALQEPSLDALEIESLEGKVLIRDETSDEKEMLHQIHLSTVSLVSMSKTITNIPHVHVRLKEFAVHSSIVTSGSRVWKELQSSSILTHLAIQAGLTTQNVDQLLMRLRFLVPCLQELDLEGNDMDSLDFGGIFSSCDNGTLFHSLERLYMGWNLFPYMTQTESIVHLLKICPRLDVGQRNVLSCGIFSEGARWERINDEQTNSTMIPPPLFTSWAQHSPKTLALSDWNNHGRYMILQTQEKKNNDASSLAPCPAGVWPYAIEKVTRKFSERSHRQATLIYQFLRSGAIPLSS